MANRWANNGNTVLQTVTAAMKLKDVYSLKNNLRQTYTVLKRRDIILLTKIHTVKAIVFLVVKYGLRAGP